MTDNEARALLVLSKDYGELGVALSLLRGQEFARRARMLLPPPLFSINKEALPVAASPYATLDEILRVVEAHEPDLVFLLSGYLLSNDQWLSRESLDTFLQRLRDRDCRVITSDPFLGLAPRLTLAQVDARIGAPSEPIWARWLTLLMLRLQGSRAKPIRVPSLEAVTHLYPTATPDCDDQIQRLAFFNPTIIRADTGAPSAGGLDPRPRWLFVLSLADVHVQRVLVGLREFIARLLGILRQAQDANRRPTLIAPSWLVQRLPSALPDSVEVLSSCPFADFERRLLDAEYVFYWNAFSFSLATRVANELPIFFFDRGHLARTIKPYYDIARSCHFGGWEPTYLDQRQPLDPRTLAELGEKQKPALRMIRKRWESSPSPDELVAQLCRNLQSP